MKEKVYHAEEIEVLYQDYLLEIMKSVIGENNSLEEVQTSLNFLKELKQYPFISQWSTSNYKVIDTEGVVYNEEISEEGMIIEISLMTFYYQWVKEHTFSVRVMPPNYLESEKIKIEIEHLLQEEDKRSQYQDNIILPKTLGNQKLEWSIEKENLSITIFVLVLILCISYFFAYQVQIRKNDQLEKEQMQQDQKSVV